MQNPFSHTGAIIAVIILVLAVLGVVGVLPWTPVVTFALVLGLSIAILT